VLALNYDLKPIDSQVIVITGASSGIGLATAKAAAAAGAKVMLAARDEHALERICNDLKSAGGDVDFRKTDVGEEEQVQALADRTIERFGGFDTWVNNAGVGLIATVDKTSTEDHQQIFRTNYFGVVHGSIAAVRYFRRKREPAALINLGSVVSDMPSPLSVAYSATKHAIKGFTDGLRIELMQEELPISVTLIKPSAIDTRFFDHAKTEMGGMGKAPGPHYAPDVVAAAIIHAAQHQKRDFPVGATAVFAAAAEQVAPEFVDKQQSLMKLSDLVDFGHMPEADSLYETPDEGEERPRYGHGRRYSMTTTGQIHQKTTLGLLAAAGAGAALALFATRSARGGNGR
jgi:short-subunit dehydrogenase